MTIESTVQTCSYCNRDVLFNFIDQHEKHCSDDRPPADLIKVATEGSVRTLLAEMIEKRPFFADLAQERLSVPAEEMGDSDIGLASYEREDTE